MGDGTVDASTVYVYDGSQIALQFDKSGTGSASASDLSHRYLWGPTVDQILADEQLSPPPPGEGQGEGFDLSTPGDVVWPLTDQLGTVRDLAVYNSQTGVTSIANHRVYDSYGNLTSQTNSAVDCVFGFTGRMLDKDTGLQNNLNRWYDSKVGRWMNEDPIGFNGRDANLGRYVGNSPTNATDPLGLDQINPVTGQPLPGPSPLPPGFSRDPVTGQPVPGPQRPVTPQSPPSPSAPYNPQQDFYGSDFDQNRWISDYQNAIAHPHDNRNFWNQNPSYEYATTHWIHLPDWQAAEHRKGCGNENNEKFVSPDGHYEAIFRNGRLVTDQTNGGTYNYDFNPGPDWYNNSGHIILDWLPYKIWGNGPGK